MYSCQKSESAHKSNYHFPFAPDIVVDGAVNDWMYRGLTIPLAADVWGNSNPGSFSATVSLVWDDHSLYLLAEVVDDTIFQDNTGPIWKNDGLEIFFSKQKGSNNIIHYLVAPALTKAFPKTIIETLILALQSLRRRNQIF